jgi:hypothetical protein
VGHGQGKKKSAEALFSDGDLLMYGSEPPKLQCVLLTGDTGTALVEECVVYILLFNFFFLEKQGTLPGSIMK